MMNEFEQYLLARTHASACIEIEVIQSLWSGYGKIVRYQLMDAAQQTVVVKCISIASTGAHPKGWDTDFSHQRKVRSYQVETNWYQAWNARCHQNCRTPKFIGSYQATNKQWIVLEDLDHHFPLRKQALNIPEVKICLQWLATFHATFLHQKPKGLWPVGTYWHLATRPDEYEKIEHQALKAKAHLIDERLNNCQYQTLVHGDAKVANFCFAKNGAEVAAVDFQYVGGGCGMKDVAYFMGSCLTSDALHFYEKELLNYYFHELRAAIKTEEKLVDSEVLESEWRRMYPFACADFTRFLMGWMPSHQKINSYQLAKLQTVLSELK